MGIPQMIIVVLHAFALGITLNEVTEGHERPSKFYSKLVGTAIMFALLWWGGFFT